MSAATYLKDGVFGLVGNIGLPAKLAEQGMQKLYPPGRNRAAVTCSLMKESIVCLDISQTSFSMQNTVEDNHTSMRYSMGLSEL